MKFPLCSLCSATLFVAAISPATAEEAKPPAKTMRTEADFNAISSALKAYKLNAGNYPTEEQGLKALVDKPTTSPIPARWTKIASAVPKDPWGREYRYAVRVKDGKKETVLLSDGPDAEDKKDDLESVVDSEAVEKK